MSRRHLTQEGTCIEEIENQKGIEQAVKADAIKSEIKKDKKYLIDILGHSVVNKVYKDKLDALHQIEAKLELDLSKPLEEQDPIVKLNLLTKKKRKNDDDLHDYFKSTKRTFSSFLVAEVEKRNLNPNKQMTLIEHPMQ
ncbi:hypothetical protein Tco_0973086 [Tanacetum coccineum]